MANKTGSIRKDREFQAFISHLEAGTTAHWIDMARILGVDKDTIQRWKALPEARIAIRSGINEAVKQMQEAGKKDWRMWESKLKMLGIAPAEKTELKFSEPFPGPIFTVIANGKRIEKRLNSEDSPSGAI